MERQFSSSEAFKKLRERAEHILKEEKREKVNVEEDDILRLVHELEIHQVELEIQNDELRRTQKDLQASRDEFFDLYESSPVAYVSLNQKDVIERANKAAQRLLKDFQKIGPAREFYLWVYWEDIRIYHAFVERFSMHKEAGPVELRLRGEEGPFYVQMEERSINA